MPISDEQLWELINKLTDDLHDLRAENTALTELLLKQTNLLYSEEIVTVPPSSTAIGKEPWYIKQRRLEKEFRKPRLSEIAGIPDEEDHG